MITGMAMSRDILLDWWEDSSFIIITVEVSYNDIKDSFSTCGCSYQIHKIRIAVSNLLNTKIVNITPNITRELG